MKLELEKINFTPKALEEATETIGHLVKIIIELKKENDLLREQSNNNSKNSSIPPSRDIKKKKQTKASTGRKRGGQPGHKAWQRSTVPAEKVDTIVDCKPTKTCDCGGLIKLKDKVHIHQVFEIPVAKYEVTEYRLYNGCCESVHEETFAAVQKEKVVHVDETGHKESNRSGWAWIASVPQYTCFMLNRSRGKKVAKELIGHYQGRVMVTDRYAAYNYLPYESHQICWAHLKRDFQKISERPDKPGRIGKKLLMIYNKTFDFWKNGFKEELRNSKSQKKRLKRLKNHMLRWLVAGTYCGHEKTARTCENILSLQHSLWHFFDNPNVPPTNNHAERQLRPLVISKKLTYGTQSERGSRYIERIFTVVTSCKQQAKDTLGFLTSAVQQYFLGQAAPSLIAAD